MIDPAADLAPILADCGGPAQTVRGDIVGRFVEEPVDIETAAGILVEGSEAVFYTSRAELEAVGLVRDDWIEISGVRRYIKRIPRADISGLVRVELKQ